jgi:hypothetical protein
MTRIVLWVDGIIDQGQAATEKAFAEIAATDFDVVFFCHLHVRPDGSLAYDDTPVGQLWSGVPAALKALRNGGAVAIGVSIGGPDAQSDFTNAAGALSAFSANLTSFCTTYSVDVVSLDFCGPYTAQYQSVIAAIAKGWTPPDGVFLSVAGDYTQMAWWVGQGGLLSRTTNGEGNQIFASMNLKFFVDDTNIQPDQWEYQFGEWTTHLAANAANGVQDADAFLAPGANAVAGYTLADFTQGIDSVASSYPDATGAFVYDYTEIQGSAAAWASAIRAAFPDADD